MELVPNCGEEAGTALVIHERSMKYTVLLNLLIQMTRLKDTEDNFYLTNVDRISKNVIRAKDAEAMEYHQNKLFSLAFQYSGYLNSLSFSE